MIVLFCYKTSVKSAFQNNGYILLGSADYALVKKFTHLDTMFVLPMCEYTVLVFHKTVHNGQSWSNEF